MLGVIRPIAKETGIPLLVAPIALHHFQRVDVTRQLTPKMKRYVFSICEDQIRFPIALSALHNRHNGDNEQRSDEEDSQEE